MSDDSADKRAVGAHPESFSGRAHPRWTSWTQADPDPMCFRSCIVDTQHRRAVAHGVPLNQVPFVDVRSSNGGRGHVLFQEAAPMYYGMDGGMKQRDGFIA